MLRIQSVLGLAVKLAVAAVADLSYCSIYCSSFDD